jgi:L-ascorbate metabolism protein UlaG (beta-lactamase superfamily)
LHRLLYERIFPRWRPRDELRPRTASASGSSLFVRWMGTAAHVVESATARVAIDPFVSRPGLGRLVGGALASDEQEVFDRFGTRLDAVLCGHSHYDHLLDAPLLARATGAKLVGSRTTCAFGRAAGLPESQLVEVPAEGARVAIGDLAVRFIPSLHGRILFGRVPFEGEVEHVASLPAPARRYRMGGAFGIFIRAADGASVYHNGSADLVDAELLTQRADVLLIGLAGRQSTRDYVARLVRALEPKVIVPTHHDAFFAPLGWGVHLLPNIDLDGFVTEAHRFAPRARVVTPDYGEVLAVPASAPGEAALLV